MIDMSINYYWAKAQYEWCRSHEMPGLADDYLQVMQALKQRPGTRIMNEEEYAKFTDKLGQKQKQKSE